MARLDITMASVSAIYSNVDNNAGGFDTEGYAMPIEFEKRRGKCFRRVPTLSAGSSRDRYQIDVYEDSTSWSVDYIIG